MLSLMERHAVRVVGRVWIKDIGVPVDGVALYTNSIQAICASFQNLLRETGDHGIVIADSRSKAQNANVAHSIFTLRYKAAGDNYDRLIDLPTFGHSDNHAGLQVADFVCSALLFPMAVHAYCAGHVNNIHVRPAYSVLRSRYGERIERLQYRYQDATHRWRGGIVVADPLGEQPSWHLLRTPPVAAALPPVAPAAVAAVQFSTSVPTADMPPSGPSAPVLPDPGAAQQPAAPDGAPSLAPLGTAPRG
jgi:hypothetical protein